MTRSNFHPILKIQEMREVLDFGLLLAGVCFVMLTVACFFLPGALGWKEKLSNLSPLMRQMFYTYAGYVFATHVFFGVLTLGYRDWLLSGTEPAAWMVGFMLLWWVARLVIQFFGFDLRELEMTLGMKVAKGALTFMFLCLVTIFSLTLWWNLGGLR